MASRVNSSDGSSRHHIRELPLSHTALALNRDTLLDKYVIISFRPCVNGFEVVHNHFCPEEAINEITHAFVCNSLDELGRTSARQQGLHKPITGSGYVQTLDHDRHRLLTTANDTSFILFNYESQMLPNTGKVNFFNCLGFVRHGTRTLFFNHNGTLTRFPGTRVVLDFHTLIPRTGCGKVLFDFLLAQLDDIPPHYFAFDLPSAAMHSFLRKHYNMLDYSEEHNKFTIFKGYMDQYET